MTAEIENRSHHIFWVISPKMQELTPALDRIIEVYTKASDTMFAAFRDQAIADPHAFKFDLVDQIVHKLATAEVQSHVRYSDEELFARVSKDLNNFAASLERDQREQGAGKV